MNAVCGIARLAAHRTLRSVWPGVLALVLILGWDSTSSVDAPALNLGASLRAPTADDVRRSSDWSIALWCLVPLLVLHAAASARRWPQQEGIWIGCRGISRRRAVVAWMVGIWLAGCALCALAFLAIEMRSGSQQCPRALGTVGHRALLIQGAGAEVRLPLRSVPVGAMTLRARFATTLGPDPGAGPLARVRVSALASDAAPPAGSFGDAQDAEGFGRFVVDVPLRPGPAPDELYVATPESGPGCLLAKSSLEALGSSTSSRWAALRFALRVVLGLGAAIAFAFGVGARLSAPIAGALVLCPWVIAWTRELPQSWWPAGDLWHAIALVGEGLAPSLPDAVSVAVALGIVVTGVELARAGLAPGDPAR